MVTLGAVAEEGHDLGGGEGRRRSEDFRDSRGSARSASSCPVQNAPAPDGGAARSRPLAAVGPVARGGGEQGRDRDLWRDGEDDRPRLPQGHEGHRGNASPGRCGRTGASAGASSAVGLTGSLGDLGASVCGVATGMLADHYGRSCGLVVRGEGRLSSHRQRCAQKPRGSWRACLEKWAAHLGPA